MKELAYRILDVLSREIGNPMSINQLTDKVDNIYGSAYYPNIYKTIQELKHRDYIILEKMGKSSFIALNFSNPLVVDILAETEIRRKTLFLETRPEVQLLLLELNAYIRDFYFVKSISMINPEKYIKLNRVELLILLRDSEEKGDVDHEIKDIRGIMNVLTHIHNIRIDHLILNEKRFLDLLKTDETNTAREILSNKIVLSYPQTFWIEIMTALKEGMNIKVEEHETNPAKISDQDIVFNLARFGYKEIGSTIIQGKPIGMEYIITAILLKSKSIRHIEAIPIIIAKNEKKINYNLLVFLATKYNVLTDLYKLLALLNQVRPNEEVAKAVNGLKEVVKNRTKKGMKELELSLKDIEEKMRLYDVIK